MNQFYIEFFELANLLKNTLSVDNKDKLHKTLLKLNNPTYYSKYVITNPINTYGFNSKIIKNPVLLAIKNMLNILSINSNNTDKLLQTELAWAYNNYPKYVSFCN